MATPQLDATTTPTGTSPTIPHTQPRLIERVLPVRGTTVRLSVPLDSTKSLRPDYSSADEALPARQTHKTSGRRTHIRRDSLDRREAFLKGTEGSRQRRRWENDRLLSNPWAVAPLPTDFEVRPTYPTRSVPYYLAPLWDAAEFQRSVEAKLQSKKSNNDKHSAGKRGKMSPAEEAATNVPKEVRAKLKRARAAKGLLQDLEEQVRLFLQKWNERQTLRERDGLGDAPIPRTPRQSFHLVKKPKDGQQLPSSDSALLSDSDSDISMAGDDDDDDDDDEIVFVGRSGTTLDSPGHKKRETEALSLVDTDPHNHTTTTNALSLTHDKLVYEGPESSPGAGFARWLVHSIGTYYGLRTWSVTTGGEPAMREAYVGVDRTGWGRYAGRCQVIGDLGIELPRPLWGMI